MFNRHYDWLRQRVTKGPGSRTAGIAVAYKLIDAAQARWPSRRRLPQRQTARTTHRHHTRTVEDRPQNRRNRGRLKLANPQVSKFLQVGMDSGESRQGRNPYCATVQLQDSAQEFLNTGTGPITCNAAAPNQPRAP